MGGVKNTLIEYEDNRSNFLSSCIDLFLASKENHQETDIKCENCNENNLTGLPDYGILVCPACMEFTSILKINFNDIDKNIRSEKPSV